MSDDELGAGTGRGWESSERCSDMACGIFDGLQANCTQMMQYQPDEGRLV